MFKRPQKLLNVLFSLLALFVFSAGAQAVIVDGRPVSTTNPLPTHVVEIHSVPYNEFFHQHTGIISTLTVATDPLGTDSTITVANGGLFTVNDEIQISNGAYEPTHPVILSIATNVLTLDRRVDFGHEIGTNVEIVTSAMNVSGTLINPYEFILIPDAGNIVNVTRLMLTMSHGTAGDLGLFGNLAALTNGVLIRTRQDGQYHTYTNWKTNGDIKTDMFNVEFDTRSGGGGTFGTSGRNTYLNLGIAIRLDPRTSDQMEVYVQDDLSTIIHFNMKGQGYVEPIQ